MPWAHQHPRPKEAPMVKTTLHLPEPLWHAAKVRALDERSDLRSVMIAALEAYLRGRPRGRSSDDSPRRPPRRAPGATAPSSGSPRRAVDHQAALPAGAAARHKKRSARAPRTGRKAERALARSRAEVEGGTWLPDAERTTFELLAQDARGRLPGEPAPLGARVDYALAHLRAAFGAAARAPSPPIASSPTRGRARRPARPTRPSTASWPRSSGCSGSARSRQGRPPPPHPDARGAQRPHRLLRGAGLPTPSATTCRAISQPVAEVAYITGWRVASELLTRQWSHVDFAPAGSGSSPGETKNGEGRMFALRPSSGPSSRRSASTRRALEREQGRIIPWVFHRHGEPIKSFRRGVADGLSRAGVPGPASRTTSGGRPSGTSSGPGCRAPRR